MIRFFIFTTCLIRVFSGAAQGSGSVVTNQIFFENKKTGVKAPNGSVLIPPVYRNIYMYMPVGKNTYNGDDDNNRFTPTPFYIVTDTLRRQAIFTEKGRMIFGFVDAVSLEMDTLTHTVVATKTDSLERSYHFLYSLSGTMLDTTPYTRIGYFKSIPLVILQRSREEVYLFHPDLHTKTGPYDHFNVWENQQVLAVRHNDTWGLVDYNGKARTGMSYTQLRQINSEDEKRLEKITEKPPGVTFIGVGLQDKAGYIWHFFDSNFEAYKVIYENYEAKSIRKLD